MSPTSYIQVEVESINPPAVSNLYLTCITGYDMESTAALMFVVIGASMGLFGMVLLVMIKTFQEVKSNMT